MAETARPLQLVKTPAPPSREAFASAVMQCLRDRGDVTSEDCWQRLAVRVATPWPTLGQDQSPQESWSRLGKCTEEILRIRRVARGSQRESGADALEAFRAFMGEVMGKDDRHT